MLSTAALLIATEKATYCFCPPCSERVVFGRVVQMDLLKIALPDREQECKDWKQSEKANRV
jgi:hypothetical protein